MIRSFLNRGTENIFDGTDSPAARKICPKALWSVKRGSDHGRTSNKGQLVARRLPGERPPTHPGEMLLKEFLEPLNVSQSALAIQLNVSFPRLNEIVRGKRGVTPDTALRLARVVGMSADFWLGLQQDWDLWHAMQGEKASEIANLKPLLRSK